MTSKRLQRILSQSNVIGENVLGTIPINECNEALADISKVIPDIIIKMIEPRREFAGDDTLYARQQICEMLIQTVRKLSPEYRLVLFDAYRPIEYQRFRYNQRYEATRKEHPDAPEEVIQQLTFEVIFPPNEDPKQPPPHATGAAVDVTIATPQGELIDMGSTYGIYNAAENKRHLTNSKYITDIQQANRRILLEAMVEAGFCNYPGEWWHFMYGDREYAAYEGFSYAIYGRADLIS